MNEVMVLDAMRQRIATVLPSDVDVDRFIEVGRLAFVLDPNLKQCTTQSLGLAFMQAARDGLLPDGSEAVIRSFFSRRSNQYVAAYMPMVDGIQKKLRASGAVRWVTSHIVYEAEVKQNAFRFWVDDHGEHISHIISPLASRGLAVGAYAVIMLTDHTLFCEYMTAEEIEGVRDEFSDSAKRDNSPWHGATKHEMWRKTVLKRLAKRVPVAPDVSKIIERDNLSDTPGIMEEPVVAHEEASAQGERKEEPQVAAEMKLRLMPRIKTRQKEEPIASPRDTAAVDEPRADAPASENQISALRKLFVTHKVPTDRVISLLSEYGATTLQQLSFEQASQLIRRLQDSEIEVEEESQS